MIMGKSSNISDTIHGTIFMTDFEKRIISTSLFNRLHSIYQNSTVYLTFPSNRTKRFEHSFGTMELCSQIFCYSISNSRPQDLEKFFSIARINIEVILSEIETNGKEYKNKLGDKFKGFKKSYSDIFIKGGIYNNLSPRNVTELNYTLFCILLESVRIAALLHDVGHPPYSHIIEDSMENLYIKLSSYDKKTLTTRQVEFIGILERFFGEKKAKLHEEISIDISDKLLAESIRNITNAEAKDKEIYGQQIFEILVKEIVVSIFKENNNFFKNLHSIIDGPLDGDRLDYVTRDTINSGLETGRIEYKRILPTMKMLFLNDTEDFFFCPNTKILNSIEDFFDKRWSLYKKIIYHHRVVKTDYLLKNCVEDIALNYLSCPDSPEETSDNSLPYSIAGLWLALKENPSDMEFSYSMVQWDDAWLMTILKKHYFSDYIGENSITNKKLSELLTNAKHYFSIIKVMDQFAVLDSSFAREVALHINEVNEIMKNLVKKSKDNVSEPLQHNEIRINIDPFLNAINNIFKRSKDISTNKMSSQTSGFLLSEISIDLYSTGYMGTDVSFKDFILQQSDKIKDVYKDRIEDILVVFKNANTGTDKRLFCYSDIGENTELKTFKEISNSHSKLQIEVKLFPPFFIYILHESSFNMKEIYFNKLLDKFGIIIGIAFIENLKQALNELLSM